eukprot:9496788-Pyramimonas_sp.AAC.1
MQRALPLTEARANRVDNGVVAFCCGLLGVTTTPRARVFMQVDEGGFGCGNAAARGPLALLAAWGS